MIVFSAKICIVLYLILLIIGIINWLILKKPSGKSNDFGIGIVFSVIVPVRNEAQNILKLLHSLENQTYNFQNFEIIFVNDHSTDATKELIERFSKTSDLNIQMMELERKEYLNSPKKMAIMQAIRISKGEFIFTTDGDCVLPPKLLHKYHEAFMNQVPQFISGPVTFLESKKSYFGKLWEKIQIVEFASLLGTAAASIEMNSPNMCSGANICYRKSVFFEVNGYEGNLHLASGDDEFLMHKISKKYKNGIVFLKDSEAVVLTNACENWSQFFNQRKRWSSKWKQYEGSIPTVLAIFVFLNNLALFVLILSCSWRLILLKIILEFFMISSVLLFLNKINAIFYIGLVQFLYPFYVLFFGLIGIFSSKTYIWKERILK